MAEHLFEEPRAAALFELRRAQGLPALKKARLPLQDLVKNGNGVFEVLPLQGRAAFLEEFTDISRNFGNILFRHDANYRPERRKSRPNCVPKMTEVKDAKAVIATAAQAPLGGACL